MKPLILKKIIALFLTSLVFTVIFISLFKLLRPIFPATKIDKSGIIANVQYSGYPFYFDNLLFLIFTLTPAGTLTLFYFWEKYGK